MNSGFIYVLSNRAMPGIVKIGITKRHPLERASELRTTGVPLQFCVDFAVYCSNPQDVEAAIHERFSSERVAGDREFFSIATRLAVTAILESVQILGGEYECARWYCCVDEGQAESYASMFGGDAYDLLAVLSMFTQEEWHQAYERLQEKTSKIAAEVVRAS